MAGCAVSPPPQRISVPIVDEGPACDEAKIRAIAKRYIPTITSPTVHRLEAEMSYKAMNASFVEMTMRMFPYPKRMCWNKIEYEVDVARIAAAEARGEFKGR